MPDKPNPLRQQVHFGWKPDTPDPRDRKLKLPKTWRGVLPRRIDLRPFCSRVDDQGNLGSCTAHAITAIAELLENRLLSQRESGSFVDYSRLFIYWLERYREGTVNEDAGAMIRTGIKVFKEFGACDEQLWPYTDDAVTFKKKPSKRAFKNALKHQALSYYRVETSRVGDILSVLSRGYGVAFGFSVPTWFASEVGRKKVMRMPHASDAFDGGHATAIVCADQDTRLFTIKNSWAPNWGDAGYFHAPFDFVTNGGFCDDFWTIMDIEV